MYSSTHAVVTVAQSIYTHGNVILSSYYIALQSMCLLHRTNSVPPTGPFN